jgi:hypothetical protein
MSQGEEGEGLRRSGVRIRGRGVSRMRAMGIGLEVRGKAIGGREGQERAGLKIKGTHRFSYFEISYARMEKKTLLFFPALTPQALC